MTQKKNLTIAHINCGFTIQKVFIFKLQSHRHQGRCFNRNAVSETEQRNTRLCLSTQTLALDEQDTQQYSNCYSLFFSQHIVLNLHNLNTRLLRILCIGQFFISLIALAQVLRVMLKNSPSRGHPYNICRDNFDVNEIICTFAK